MNSELKNNLPKILRIGIIGGGINSAVGKAHISALNLDGLFKVVAGSFSRNHEINLKSAINFGVDLTRLYSDYAQLIDNEAGKIDAIVVLTPTTDHTTPVINALNAGIPVICEKTLTANINDALLIQNIEREKNGFLAVTYNYSGYPAVREMREIIRSGQIGDVLHFATEMPQEGYLRVNTNGHQLQPQNWRKTDGEVPMIYLDLGSHLHQLASYILGIKPVSVFANERNYGLYPVIDSVSALVNYENGIHGNFIFGKTMLGYRNGLKIRIFGTRGAVEWTQSDPERIQFAYADGRIELRDRGYQGLEFSSSRYGRFKAGHPAGYIEAFANLYVDIHAALTQYLKIGTWSSEEIVGSKCSVDGLKFMLEMHKSALSGTLNTIN